MKKVIVLFLLMAFLSVPVVKAQAEEKELNLFIWSEYMPESTWQDFEKKTGIRVRISEYESNEEMKAKLVAGGSGQYDVIVPSDYILPSLIELKMIQPLDKSKIPNLKNLDKIFQESSYADYAAAYQWGTVGIMYRKDKIKNFTDSWALLFDPNLDIGGSFNLIDGAREMMGAALLFLGYPYNSTDPKQLVAAADLLAATKKRKNCLGFKPGVGGKNDVVAGTAVAAIVFNGDAIQAIEEDQENLAFFIPKEGSEIWYDVMAIPTGAPHPEAAYQWINYILDPKVGAEISNYNSYATPNAASMPFIDEEALKNPQIYPTPDLMKKLILTKDLGKANRLMDEAWTRAKTH